MTRTTSSRLRLKLASSLLGLSLFLPGAAAPAAAQTQASAQAQSQAPAKRPNIVLIIMDDVGVDAVSDMYPGLIDDLATRYGPEGHDHPNYQRIKGTPASTPVLNRIATQGVTFSNAWAQPFCSPTRASMLTGLYAQRTGMRDYRDWLSQSQHSIAQDLRGAGYHTAAFGKWHMAGLGVYPGMKPKEASFEEFRGNLHGGLGDYWNHDYHVQDASTPDAQWRTEKAPTRTLPGIAPTSFAPVVRAADALNWIKQQQQDDPEAPWFTWFAFNLAHITDGVQPSFVPNEDTLDAPTRAEITQCGGTFGTIEIGACSPPALNRSWVNAIDTTIGVFLSELRKSSPNTYVIILGDNGTPMYGRPEIDFIDNMYITIQDRAKGTAYESGVRVPMTIIGPGIAPGRNDSLVHVVDVASTVLDLAGIAAPAMVPDNEGAMVPLDSISLTPILFEGKDTVRDPETGYLISETVIPLKNEQKQVAIQSAHEKLVYKEEKSGAQSCEFYDLARDPLEEYPLRTDDLSPHFRAFIAEQGYTCTE